jgi:hypothetical protein
MRTDRRTEGRTDGLDQPIVRSPHALRAKNAQ